MIIISSDSRIPARYVKLFVDCFRGVNFAFYFITADIYFTFIVFLSGRDFILYLVLLYFYRPL